MLAGAIGNAELLPWRRAPDRPALILPPRLSRMGRY